MRTLLSRFIFPLALDVVTLVLICTLFQRNALLFIGILAVFLVTLWHRCSREKLIIACFALIFGTIGEYVSCRLSVWIYANPTYLRLPIWLPMIWPILMLTFFEIASAISEVGQKIPRWLFSAFIWLLRLIIIAYALSAFYYIDRGIAIALGIFFTLFLVFARRPFNVIYFVVAAAGGFYGEYICVQHEVWFYTRPLLRSIGMPFSLPLAWGVSANVIWLAAMGLVKLRTKNQKAQVDL